ncbi:MAG: methyltransferase family protein, partial [Paracoccaceae bacterium]
MTVADPILAKSSGRIVFGGLPNKIFASPNFQRFISKVPILRRVARQEGEALFDLVMGFVQSQALYALVKLNTLEHLLDGPLSLEALADRARVPVARMEILLQAGVALKLLRRHRRGRY